MRWLLFALALCACASTVARADQSLLAYIEQYAYQIDLKRCKPLLKKALVNFSRLNPDEIKKREAALRSKDCLDRYTSFTNRLPAEGEKKFGVDVGLEREELYIRVPAFDFSEMDKALLLHLAGLQFLNIDWKAARTIILDLRDNGGGLLDEALGLMELFAPEKGRILFEEHTREGKNIQYTKGLGPLGGRRYILLVNKGTASAAELFVGTLRLWYPQSSKLVGAPTYGKSTVVQEEPNYHVLMSTGEFLLNGERIEGRGLKPDQVAKTPCTVGDGPCVIGYVRELAPPVPLPQPRVWVPQLTIRDAKRY